MRGYMLREVSVPVSCLQQCWVSYAIAAILLLVTFSYEENKMTNKFAAREYEKLKKEFPRLIVLADECDKVVSEHNCSLRGLKMSLSNWNFVWLLIGALTGVMAPVYVYVNEKNIIVAEDAVSMIAAFFFPFVSITCAV